MKIGFVNLFAWRPHMEHMIYLARSCRKEGHEVSFLQCNAALPNCYAREIRQSGKLIGCTRCIAGSVSGYEAENISFLDPRLMSDLSKGQLQKLARSSACTLTRIEDPNDLTKKETTHLEQKLSPAVSIVYQNTLSWIEAEQLSAIVLFNGRIESLAAILQAAKDKEIPIVTHERGWFGDGLHMVMNDNCLSLKNLHEIVAAYDGKPLKENQAYLASHFIARRLIGQKTNEWRNYNLERKEWVWHLDDNLASQKRVLIVPSSRNEKLSHEDWSTEWFDNLEALGLLLTQLNLEAGNYLLRAHPNWSESIGKASGSKIDTYYRDWCAKKDIGYVAPQDKISTQHLMEQADIVVTNGSTAAIEAGFLGKRVINLGAASYSQAGFAETLHSKAEFNGLKVDTPHDPKEVITKTLRYIYSHGYRYTQFSDAIKLHDSCESHFYEVPVANKLLAMFKMGKITAYDNSYASENSAEEHVVSLVQKKDWHALFKKGTLKKNVPSQNISRRHLLRVLSHVRRYFKVGDR